MKMYFSGSCFMAVLHFAIYIQYIFIYFSTCDIVNAPTIKPNVSFNWHKLRCTFSCLYFVLTPASRAATLVSGMFTWSPRTPRSFALPSSSSFSLPRRAQSLTLTLSTSTYPKGHFWFVQTLFSSFYFYLNNSYLMYLLLTFLG